VRLVDNLWRTVLELEDNSVEAINFGVVDNLDFVGLVHHFLGSIAEL
jgi:hypothetical protein